MGQAEPGLRTRVASQGSNHPPGTQLERAQGQRHTTLTRPVMVSGDSNSGLSQAKPASFLCVLVPTPTPARPLLPS